MASELLQEILAASDIPDSGEAGERVKDVVSAALQRVESDGMKVRRTRFFNHSFTPDFILEWPDRKIDRPVYLRMSDDPEDLQADIETLRETSPMLVSLGDDYLESLVGDSETRLSVEAAARQERAMVADLSSVTSLQAASTGGFGSKLFTAGAVKAARGFLRAADVVSASETVEAGFEGAQRVDSQATQDAVQVIEDILDVGRAPDVLDVLQAVWVGAGGSATEFPGPIETLTATLDSATLRILLQQDGIDRDEFWQRVSTGVDVDVLSGLDTFPAAPSLQRLMRWVAPNLIVSRAKLLNRHEETPPLGWTVEESAPTLTLPGQSIRFQILDQRQTAEPPAHPLELHEVRDRTEVSGFAVQGLKSETPNTSVTVTANGPLGLFDPDGEALTLSGSAPVTRVDVRVRGTSILVVDLLERVAKSRSNGRFFATDVAAVLVALVGRDHESGLTDLTTAFEQLR